MKRPHSPVSRRSIIVAAAVVPLAVAVSASGAAAKAPAQAQAIECLADLRIGG